MGLQQRCQRVVPRGERALPRRRRPQSPALEPRVLLQQSPHSASEPVGMFIFQTFFPRPIGGPLKGKITPIQGTCKLRARPSQTIPEGLWPILNHHLRPHLLLWRINGQPYTLQRTHLLLYPDAHITINMLTFLPSCHNQQGAVTTAMYYEDVRHKVVLQMMRMMRSTRTI